MNPLINCFNRSDKIHSLGSRRGIYANESTINTPIVFENQNTLPWSQHLRRRSRNALGTLSGMRGLSPFSALATPLFTAIAKGKACFSSSRKGRSNSLPDGSFIPWQKIS